MNHRWIIDMNHRYESLCDLRWLLRFSRKLRRSDVLSWWPCIPQANVAAAPWDYVGTGVKHLAGPSHGVMAMKWKKMMENDDNPWIFMDFSLKKLGILFSDKPIGSVETSRNKKPLQRKSSAPSNPSLQSTQTCLPCFNSSLDPQGCANGIS